MFWGLPIVWPITLHVIVFPFHSFLGFILIFNLPTLVHINLYITNWDWNSIISNYNFKLYIILLNDSIRLLKGGETNYYSVLTPCIIKKEKKKPFLSFFFFLRRVPKLSKIGLCQCSHLNFWNSSMALFSYKKKSSMHQN